MGLVDANYNWWGKNNLKTVRNLKVKRYVIAILVAPNILKVNKKYNVGVKFRSNKYKKLKKKIPNLVVFFGFEGGKISPKYSIVKKHVAKTKIKMNKHKAINFVAQVDNQLLYKQYIPFRGKLYEYGLYKRIMEKIIQERLKRLREAQERARKEAEDRAKLGLATHNALNGFFNSPYPYTAMGKDLAKSTSIIIKPPTKIIKPIIYSPGVGYAPPNSDLLTGMILRNIPPGSTLLIPAKLASYAAIASKSSPIEFLLSIYTQGKIADAQSYAQKNSKDLFGYFNKLFSYTYFNVYGYSNINNYGWAGEALKATLEFGMGIDEHGNMSTGDLIINIMSLALGLGVGGLIGKGTKNLTQAILKKIPTKFRTEAAKKVVKNFVKQVGKFTDKTPIGKISASSLKDGIVDVAKVLTGDFSSVLKNINTSSKTLNTSIKSFNKAYRSAESILSLAKGDLRGALKLLNTNISTMSKLLQNKEFKIYLEGLESISTSKSNINAIIKALNNGPSDIEKAYEELRKNPSKNNIKKAQDTIKKYTELMKKFEKLNV